MRVGANEAASALTPGTPLANVGTDTSCGTAGDNGHVCARRIASASSMRCEKWVQFLQKSIRRLARCRRSAKSAAGSAASSLPGQHTLRRQQPLLTP